MRDDDALDNNPGISRSELEAIHGQVYGWALSRCNYDRSVAEDLLQQAYVELLSGKARFDGRSSLKTFVFSVVSNLANARYRRLATRLRLHAEHAAFAEPPAPPVGHGDGDAIWSAVMSLPARQRDIIELVFAAEMTIEEASAVMGVSVGSGRQHYERAKRSLRARLAGLKDGDA
jgi:RNA polymerase sigma-70 factor (ECF subfamily)